MGMIGYAAAVKASQVPNVPEGAPTIDLDKAWHGIHFLLTGEAYGGDPPLRDALLGGVEVGPDRGYGPARLVSPEKVAAVADALRPLTPDRFAARFDPEGLAANDIYPSIWDEGAEALDYLVGNYTALRELYLAAAGRGDAVLVWIS